MLTAEIVKKVNSLIDSKGYKCFNKIGHGTHNTLEISDNSFFIIKSNPSGAYQSFFIVDGEVSQIQFAYFNEDGSLDELVLHEFLG